MKTAVVVGVVIGLHLVAATAVFLAPGCGTSRTAQPERQIAVMPEPLVVTPDPRPPIQPPVAPRPVETVRPEPVPDFKEYVVQPGDVLSRIARRAGVSVSEIVALNNLSDPNRITVGMTLLLPSHARLDRLDDSPRPVAPVVAPAVPADAITYEVQPGDAISTIAQRYGVTVQDIVQANNLADPNIVRVGQKIVIPKGKPRPTPVRPTPREQDPLPAPQTWDPVPPVRATETGRSTNLEAPVMDEDMEALLESSGAGTVHIVRQGETLASVAAAYNRRAEDIMRHNNLTSRHIVTGQSLKIPRE